MRGRGARGEGGSSEFGLSLGSSLGLPEHRSDVDPGFEP